MLLRCAGLFFFSVRGARLRRRPLPRARRYNVMEETHLINDVKERLCYVSLDFDNELALTRFKGKKNTLRREFVMPDYVNHFRGRIRDPNEPAEARAANGEAGGGASAGRDASGAPPKKKANVASDEQVLKVGNERIAVPEVLFSPADIGIEQAGLAECIVQSVDACVPDLRDALYANIVLTGGSTLFPNFAERLRRELRALVPGDTELEVTHAADPLCAAWKGGAIFAASEAYASQVVTRDEYHEHGHALCRRRFAVGKVL